MRPSAGRQRRRIRRMPQLGQNLSTPDQGNGAVPQRTDVGGRVGGKARCGPVDLGERSFLVARLEPCPGSQRHCLRVADTRSRQPAQMPLRVLAVGLERDLGQRTRGRVPPTISIVVRLVCHHP